MKYTEKLSRLILFGIYATLAFFVVKYFGTIVGYVLLSFVLALIAKPLMALLKKIKVKGKSAPSAILAIVSILIIFTILGGIFVVLIPVIGNVVTLISEVSGSESLEGISANLADLNVLLREILRLEPDFKVEELAVEKLASLLDFDILKKVIGALASTFAGIGVGLFSVIFISFFMIKDETMFPRFINAITPEKHAEYALETLKDVEHLLSRYFVGMLIEMSCVGFLNFVGLWSVARLDFQSALGIGFLAGILNIIPYIGPLIGGVLGTVMGVVVKYCCVESMWPAMDFWAFVLILAAIFIVAQLVDNTLLQPIIYSTSIKAHPLEIFFVLLVAGTIGGILGMLIAIPTYTILRVFTIHFFPNSKIVRTLLL